MTSCKNEDWQPVSLSPRGDDDGVVWFLVLVVVIAVLLGMLLNVCQG